MMCKQCKICFNKDLKLLTIQDDYCVSCENKWNIPGKIITDFYTIDIKS